MAIECDVAVLGAGPAGAATARRLAQRGRHVVLLERSCFEAPRVGESLAPATQPLLAQLGVWLEFQALSPLRSYGTRSLWGDEQAQEHSHLTSPYGCGWHVDRVAFDRMLAGGAAAAGAELRRGSELVHCAATRDGRWLLRFDERGTCESAPVRARVLIDATGRAAHLARWVRARRVVFDHLVAVAAMFGGIDTAREGFVLVEACREGWWYSAPVPPDGMMAMLMTDGDLCRQAGLRAAARWLEALARAPATSARVCGTMLWGPRPFSAVSQRLHRTELDAPWIAVGDAALAVDPISGSGVVRALRSARAAADVALAVLDGASGRVIQAYDAERQLECAQYLRERAAYYGLEQRWPESRFWKRRSAGRPRSPLAIAEGDAIPRALTRQDLPLDRGT